MAFSQENPHIKNDPRFQHARTSGKRPNGQPYVNGFPNTHSHLTPSPINVIAAPTRTALTQQHAVTQPQPIHSVQVVIPSPRQAYGTPNIKISNGLGQSPMASPRALPVDYQLLMLSLAEEYFAAAHSGGSMVALWRRRADMYAYHKLIATGLGCLEAALKNWRLEPLLEAKVRLRYATVLHDETENSMEAEEALSKGVTTCDRLRNFDLKYNIQHLLARVLNRRNSRAALRYLDGIIRDVEAYQHVAWIYAFRFLRVSLSLESPSHQDMISAIHHLRAISIMSESYGDKAILAMAVTLEVLVYLRLPSGADNVEQAQRALAAARSSQLDSAIGQIPQLAAMTDLADLCWTMRSADPLQVTQKLQAMQATLEALQVADSLTEAGTFTVPINSSQASFFTSSTGIVRGATPDSQSLFFDWLPTEDVYDLGFLLSAVCTAHKNAFDGLKSEHMLKEGIRRLDTTIETAAKTSQSVLHAASRRSWRQLQKCFMQLHLTFALCARTSWSAAIDQLSLLKDTMNQIESYVPTDLRMITLYLEGVAQQGTGALDNALSIFANSTISLPETNKTPRSQHRLDISILAALNTLLIIRSRTDVSEDAAHLIHRLGPLCIENPNKAILSAYNLVLATVPSDDTIVHNKQCLQNALQAAKACANNQLMCLTLNLMSYKFFRGVVGEQAEKSARASQSLAQKGKDILWMSVSAGLLADTLEIQGRLHQAEAVRAEGRKVADALPEAVRWHSG